MSKQYIFIGTLLPDLKIGEKPDLDFSELMILLKNNLSEEDFAQVEIFRRYYDIMNMRALWRNDPFFPYGNLDRNELEEAVLDQENLPDYVIEFLQTYQSNTERLKHFSSLLAAYFQKEVKDAKGFLKDYLQFERQLRLILVAFRAKELNRDLNLELEFESSEDDLVIQLLSAKDAKTFEPPPMFNWLRPVFEQHYENPLDLQKNLVEFQFNRIEDMIGFDVFSFDRILAYMAQLIMVEQWLLLDREKGIAIVDNILKESS